MAYQPFPNNSEALRMAQAQGQFRPPPGHPWPFYPVPPQAQGFLLRPAQQPRASTPLQSQEDSSQDIKTTVASAADPRLGKKVPVSFKGLFSKDLKEIMFGLGDEAPAPDTIALMEDILVEYLHETIVAAGQTSGKTIQTDDLRRVLQGPGDERKLARLEELILLQVEIKKARAINGLEAGGKNLGD